MTLTLAAPITADDPIIRIAGEGADDPVGALFRVGDEVIAFQDVAQISWAPDPDVRWSVNRGVNGSTPAAHGEGEELVAVRPVVSESGFALEPSVPHG